MANPLALIIEDDSNLALIFSRAIEGAGYEIETARDGQSALDQLVDLTPDIVILDLHLPRVSGKDVLGYIQEESRFTDTKIILATADPRLAEQLESDVDLVLIKPISVRQLRTLTMRFHPKSHGQTDEADEPNEQPDS